MRLIDADALPKYTGYALSAAEVAKAVENAPTIDAEPVRRGKWEVWYHGGTSFSYTCSFCGMHTPNEATPYCAYCGAKMEA